MKWQLVDTHCHVAFRAYKEDMDAVIENALQQGTAMITVGTQQDTSRQAVELANKYPTGVYAAIGLHPTHTIKHGFNDTQELDFKPRQEVFDADVYEGILQLSDKVVAIGECGLDYYRLPSGEELDMKKRQWAAFSSQAQFAARHKLPVVIHCRDAHKDMVAAIREAESSFTNPRTGVIHCFTGTYEEAKAYIEMGWYISFSGIVTFAKEVAEVAKKLPLEQILIETDAPYLTPPPHRGKRNEPANVKFVAEHVAALRGLSYETFARATVQNAIKAFSLPLT